MAIVFIVYEVDGGGLDVLQLLFLSYLQGYINSCHHLLTLTGINCCFEFSLDLLLAVVDPLLASNFAWSETWAILSYCLFSTHFPFFFNVVFYDHCNWLPKPFGLFLMWLLCGVTSLWPLQLIVLVVYFFFNFSSEMLNASVISSFMQLVFRVICPVLWPGSVIFHLSLTLGLGRYTLFLSFPLGVT